jgi:hypothetical protein
MLCANYSVDLNAELIFGGNYLLSLIEKLAIAIRKPTLDTAIMP